MYCISLLPLEINLIKIYEDFKEYFNAVRGLFCDIDPDFCDTEQ